MLQNINELLMEVNEFYWVSTFCDNWGLFKVREGQNIVMLLFLCGCAIVCVFQESGMIFFNILA